MVYCRFTFFSHKILCRGIVMEQRTNIECRFKIGENATETFLSSKQVYVVIRVFVTYMSCCNASEDFVSDQKAKTTMSTYYTTYQPKKWLKKCVEKLRRIQTCYRVRLLVDVVKVGTIIIRSSRPECRQCTAVREFFG